MSSKYTKQWFTQRAFSSLKKIREGVWDYSDSLLIYVSSGVDVYESLQAENTPYHQLVTKPEHEYLKTIADQVASSLPDSFDYIDLGPGTEHKEQYLFEALKSQGKKFTYLPVDISDYYLSIARTHAEKQGIPCNPVQSSFEELPAHLGDVSRPRFISLGLTFSNYEPSVILELLQKIAGPGGVAFIGAQIRDRVDMDVLQKIYQEDVSHAMDEKLRLLGLDPETDITPRVADETICAWTTVIHSNSELEKVGIQTQDRLLVFQSRRYTKASLEASLKNVDYQLFDTGSSFIGSLIRTSHTIS
ncbi:L-histidine N(alpha)-methyltransferase [Patescibacteria group bacterium]|nr:L-histidine N(alpha)-methyltransferase [Patescibacteria group bacterium]